jgi:Raf kinase inhibitor-like YbhB/YbcL family protein
MKSQKLLAFFLGILLLSACGTPTATETEQAVAPTVEEVPAQPTKPPEPTAAPADTELPPVPTEATMSFELTSIIIGHEQPIPEYHTCDGEDVSPPLDWNDSPEGTQSFALIMDDPDAPGGTWVHWVLFNIPSETRSLRENIAPDAQLADGSMHGINSWGRPGYGGPCPPSGTHRYFFKLYALDTTLDLDDSADKEQVLAAMEGHVLAEAELMGTYSR